MNEGLKKTKSQHNAMAKYMERHKTLCVTLDKKNDADIIRWLSTQQNRSQAVRKALREVITNEQA